MNTVCVYRSQDSENVGNENSTRRPPNREKADKEEELIVALLRRRLTFMLVWNHFELHQTYSDTFMTFFIRIWFIFYHHQDPAVHYSAKWDDNKCAHGADRCSVWRRLGWVQLLLILAGSPRHTQFSSSQFCHGLHLLFTDSSHGSVDTVHPSQLRFSSSPRWSHLHRLSSDVFLVSPLHVSSKPPQSRFPAPLHAVSSWCYHFSQGLLVCGCIPIYISSSLTLSLPVSSH